MDLPKILLGFANRRKLALIVAFSFLGLGNAFAADLDYAPRVPVAVPRVPVAVPRVPVEAAQNPWCRIVPGPNHDLVGDTNLFRPMAVCYSAGVLADSYDYGRR